jgi:hypothetical protein
MGGDPVRQALASGSFGKGITQRAQHSHKDLGFMHLTALANLVHIAALPALAEPAVVA